MRQAALVAPYEASCPCKASDVRTPSTVRCLLHEVNGCGPHTPLAYDNGISTAHIGQDHTIAYHILSLQLPLT